MERNERAEGAQVRFLAKRIAPTGPDVIVRWSPTKDSNGCRRLYEYYIRRGAQIDQVTDEIKSPTIHYDDTTQRRFPTRGGDLVKRTVSIQLPNSRVEATVWLRYEGKTIYVENISPGKRKPLPWRKVSL